MPDLPSRVDLFAIGRSYVLQNAKRIDPKQVDYAGSDVNIVVGVSSVIGDYIVKHLGFRAAALTLDGCETDEDLDRWAWDHYQLLRKGASPAKVTLSLARETTTFGSGTIPVGTRVVTDTGVEYVTTTTCSFGAGDKTSSCYARAVEAGKLTQVGENAIVRFAQPGQLWDNTLTVTNPDTAAGGEDAESFDTFRNRIRDFWRTARRGILAAIEFGALTVPGVTSAQAIEVIDPDGDAARIVQLYVADSSGVSSDALLVDVRVALGEYRAAGIQVVLANSLPQIVDYQLKLAFAANVDTIALTDQVKSALVAYTNSLRVNETLLRADVMAVLSRYKEDGLVVGEDTLVAPTGDLVPSIGRTLRTTLENVVAV